MRTKTAILLLLCLTSVPVFAQETANSVGKLNTPQLMERYAPFNGFPEGYEAIGLSDALVRTCSRTNLRQTINSYWRAVREASDWKYFRQRAEQLKNLNPQSDSVAALFLQKTENKAALAHLQMRRRAIELNVQAGDCGFQPEKLPYCNEAPHFGVYQTNLDKISLGRYVPNDIQLTVKRIELGYEQIKAAASAVAASIYYLDALNELKSSGQATTAAIVAAYEQEEAAREAFWNAVLEYNSDIAQYVIWTQAGQNFDAKYLASLLILNPRQPLPAPTGNARPNPNSLLENTVPTIGVDNSNVRPAPDTLPINPAAPEEINSPTPPAAPEDSAPPVINPLPTEPSAEPVYNPVVRNQNDSYIHTVSYTPSGSDVSNWFDISTLKPAADRPTTLKEYLGYFPSNEYQNALNDYWRAAAQCRKLAVINAAIRRADEIQLPIFTALSAQNNAGESTILLLSFNIWKQTLHTKKWAARKNLLNIQYKMIERVHQFGYAYNAIPLVWPVTPFHTEAYQVTANPQSKLQNDPGVIPLADSITLEYNQMARTKSNLNQAADCIAQAAQAAAPAPADAILEQLKIEFYFADSYIEQAAEYNFSIGNYVSRWIYAKSKPLNLDEFCQSVVYKMEN